MIDMQRQEGIMTMLVIIAVGTTFLGIFQNNITLMFSGVAVILLDTVLLLDYTQRRNRPLNDTSQKESTK